MFVNALVSRIRPSEPTTCLKLEAYKSVKVCPEKNNTPAQKYSLVLALNCVQGGWFFFWEQCNARHLLRITASVRGSSIWCVPFWGCMKAPYGAASVRRGSNTITSSGSKWPTCESSSPEEFYCNLVSCLIETGVRKYQIVSRNCALLDF